MSETKTPLIRNRTPEGRWIRPRPNGWKAPFHFSIHNQAFVARVLGLQHANAKPRAGVLPWDLDKALKSAARRYQKFCGNTGRHSPHQGERERERRRIGGMATRHDHAMHETHVSGDSPVFDGFTGVPAGFFRGFTFITRERRCPVCDTR